MSDNGHEHGHGHGHGHASLIPPSCEHVHGLGLPHDGHVAGTRRTAERGRMLLTLLLTTALMVVEFLGGLWSGSLALQSDAGHLLTDVAALALSLLAITMCARPADIRRTYGYYRLEILAALANGLVLIILSGYVLVSAYHRFLHPVAVRADLVMAFALVGLAAMSAGMWLLRGSHSLNVRGAYLHIAGDALTSVAVFSGGLLMHVAPRLTWVDPVLSGLIGLAILYSAGWLVKDAIDILLEAVPANIDLAHVTEHIAAIDGVCAVHDLHVWAITSGMYALSAHVVVQDNRMTASSDGLLTQIKEVLLREHHIAHSTLQLESEAYEHVGHDNVRSP